MNNKLLILNLGVDSENTSLAFTQKWINDISINYDAVDVLTMKVGSTYQLNKNVNLFFINDQNTNYTKIYQLRKLNKLTRKLIKNNVHDYSRCIALKCNGDRCSRKQKDINTHFCGTHMKGANYGTTQQVKQHFK